MGYWNFSNIGFSCDKQDVINVRNLIECLGVDFNTFDGSETGAVNFRFRDINDIGSNKNTFNPEQIFAITNKIFKNVTIYYEREEGENTSDWYTRYEEIYDPKTQIIFIGEINYCYGENEVFGQNVFVVIKEECEQAAKNKGIPIVWDDDYPEGEEFFDLCYEIIGEQGGLRKLGTRESRKSIPAVDISEKQIDTLIGGLLEHGYNDLAIMVKDSYGVV